MKRLADETGVSRRRDLHRVRSVPRGVNSREIGPRGRWVPISPRALAAAVVLGATQMVQSVVRHMRADRRGPEAGRPDDDRPTVHFGRRCSCWAVWRPLHSPCRRSASSSPRFSRRIAGVVAQGRRWAEVRRRRACWLFFPRLVFVKLLAFRCPSGPRAGNGLS